MKTAWTVTSVLLLIHVLALAGFVGWLHSSGRLDRNRVQAAVDLFRPTIAEKAAADAEEEVKKQREAEAAQEAARLERIAAGPVQLQQQIEQDQERDEIAVQRYERFKREIADLQRGIEMARKLLADERAQLDADQQAFQAMLDKERQQREGDDFRQAVKMYEQLSSKQVKQMFMQLVAQRKTEQVVDYLAAMQLRKAAGVLKEFKTVEEIAQATQLVQQLRERGVNLPGIQTADASGGAS